MNNDQAVYNEVLSRLGSIDHPYFDEVLGNALWQLSDMAMSTVAEAVSEAIFEVTNEYK